MAKTTLSIQERINKLEAVKEMLDYLESRIESCENESKYYLEQCTDEETGEVSTDSYAFRQSEEYDEKIKAFKSIQEDLLAQY